MSDSMSCLQFCNGKFTTGRKLLTLGTKEYAKTVYGYSIKNNHQRPKSPLPSRPADISYFNFKKKGQLNTTWLGHASLMINIDGYKILTDPIFEKKVSILGPRRMHGKLPLKTEEIKDIDIVIISHDHHDHLNKNAVKHLLPVTRMFIVPLGLGKWLSSWGVPEDKFIELNWWDEYQFDDHLNITATPSQHASGRGLKDRDSTLWASWVIQSRNFNLFFSGDTGYFKGFKDIGEKLGPFDMTFLECGAYDDMWSKIHMFPEETVQAHIDLKGKLLHPIHWGTFNLSLHSWYDPMQRLTKAAKHHGIPVATPIAGQSIQYGTKNLGSLWWEAVRSQAEQKRFYPNPMLIFE